MPPMPEGGGKRREGGRVNGRHRQKRLQVNQTSGTGAPSPTPHPTAPLACPGQAFPRPVSCRFLRKTGKRKGSKRESRGTGGTKLP